MHHLLQLLFNQVIIINKSVVNCSIKLATIPSKRECYEWQSFVDLYSGYFALIREMTITTIIIDDEYGLETRSFVNKLIENTKKHITIQNNMIKMENTYNWTSNEERIISHSDFLGTDPETRVLAGHEVHSHSGVIRHHRMRLRKHCSAIHKGHVIVAWDVAHLHYYLDKYSERISDNRATFAVFILSHIHRELNRRRISTVLMRLWKQFQILNAVALSPDCSNNDAYIYRPFEYYNGSWGVINTYKFDFIRRHKYLLINPLVNLHQSPLTVRIFERNPTVVKKIPKNMRVNSIYKDLYRYGGFNGLDGNILAELVKNLNFSVSIRNGSGEFNKIIDDVSEKRVDFGVNGVFVTNYHSKKLEYTTTSFYDKLCVLVPKSKRIPQWMAIFNCFSWEAWLLFLGIILFCELFWLWLNRFVYKNFDIVQDDSWLILLVLMSVPAKISNDNCIKIKLFIMGSCMLFNVIITGIFQGNLVRSFIAINYYADINTLDQLNRSGLTISTALPVFNDSEQTPLIKSLRKRVWASSLRSLERAAYERTVAALERNRDSELYRITYTDADGVSLIHVVDECLVSYSIAHIVPKGSPYLPRFNCLIQRFFESGLVQKWYNDLVDSLVMEIRFKKPENRESNKVFSLSDMQTAFFILILGHVMGFVCLNLEICYYYRSNLKVFKRQRNSL